MQPLIFNWTPGRTAAINGEEHLFFSGYSYLGMQHVQEFTALIKEGIDKYGWLFPSSRISNTRLKLYEECEALLSSVTSAEDTVLVSSGFIAGRMAISKWMNEIINLQPSHPAIKANNNNNTNQSHQKIFAVDSIDPLQATITDFSFVEKNAPCTLIIDDSHGAGLIGANGEGIISLLSKNPEINYVLTYSLSKALNIMGGAISCSSSLAEELRAMPEYTASTAPSPALLHAFIKGQHLYAMQREKLRNNINYFQSVIKEMKEIFFHHLLPIFVLPSTIDEEKLLQQKIIISSFPYPDPKGKKVQRVVLNALHTKNDLERLTEALYKTL